MSTDHFQPEKIIAAGPSAKVYRGVETMTGRKVLIKALLEAHETVCPLDRERVQQLASSLMPMRHPHIAGLITLLPEEGEFALVAEFMPGMNGRNFAAERRPSPADLRTLAVQLMHALLAGEQLGMTHGDPKPSNLIIADHPGGGLFLQVLDWGLSLARQTQPPETLWFRAPELHAGGATTTQSDLFTAAGSLFCIATNTTPTLGTRVEEIMQDWLEFDAHEMLAHLRPDLDRPLRDWLAWLLSPAPQHRPKSVSEALEVLMQSMPAGCAYPPKQPPVMAPGAKTTQLTSRALTTRPALTQATLVPAAAELPPAAGPQKASRSRALAIALLKIAALSMIGFFVWSVMQKFIPGLYLRTAMSSEKASAAASITTASQQASAAIPVRAKASADLR